MGKSDGLFVIDVELPQVSFVFVLFQIRRDHGIDCGLAVRRQFDRAYSFDLSNVFNVRFFHYGTPHAAQYMPC